MLNSKKLLLHGVVGKYDDTNHATAMEYKYDPKKYPLWDDFASLIEQAFGFQQVTQYCDLPEPMKFALAIAALRENKTWIDAESEAFNQTIANVLEKRGSLDSLEKLYQYLIRVVIKGNSHSDPQVAYCIDCALEKEEQLQVEYDAEETRNKRGFYEDYSF